MYVIGTEVPVPGGATEAIEGLETTTPAAARATIEAHREAFRAAGLADAWERVIASVVQPGVEFDHHEVIDYVPEKAHTLSEAIVPLPGMVYEAHSTDYQTREALQALVRDHFAILKVGPGLTFALREALWALDAIERDWIAADKRANLREVALVCLREHPQHWQRYYHGGGHALAVDLQYSLSDRIRYYWPDPVIEAARERLFANLRADPRTKEASGKPMPASAAKSLLENQTNLRRAEQALELAQGKELPGGIKGDTAATGLKGLIPNQVLNRIDPAGVDTRAAIADLGSMVIHDRSGAAVTAAEFPRLAPFIPSPTDDAETVQKKLRQFVSSYRAIVDDQIEFHRELGYKVPAQVLRSGAQGTEQRPPDGSAPRINSRAELEALPSGSLFTAPDGSVRVKP